MPDGTRNLVCLRCLEVISPGIWWIGSRMNLYGSEVQIVSSPRNPLGRYAKADAVT